jgi:DNA-binding MarR family transcriptional regulator
MRKDLDEAHLVAWKAFLRAHAELTERLQEELVDAGHPPLAWYDVLVNLSHAPDRRMRMSELARSTAFSRSGLTRLVDRMEAAGLVVRQACPTDRRGAFCVLTDAGFAALRAAWPVHADGVARHFAAHFDGAEAETLAAAFARIIAALSPGAPPDAEDRSVVSAYGEN